MKKLYSLLFALIIFTLSQNIYAQKDSIAKATDSVNAVTLEAYNIKLAQIEQQRLKDSIKKSELEQQLQSLKTTDNLKKEELQKELEELENREATRLAAKREQIDKLRSKIKGSPVRGFFNDTLFNIYSKLGSFSAAERAQAITRRIEELGDNILFEPDSLKTSNNETTADLVYHDRIIVSVSENDAIWNNTSKELLAKTYQKIITDEITAYKNETSFKTLAKEVALALLVIGLLVLLIYLSGKLFHWTAEKIKQQKDKRIHGIKIKSYELFDADRQVNLLLLVNKLVKWLFILLLIYIALPVLFGIFPWTQNFAETLFGYILSPVKKVAFGLWGYLPNLITIIVLIIIFRYILKFARFLKNEIARGNLHIDGFYPDWANPTYQIVRVLILAFLLIVIFPYLPGSDSAVFKGVSVFLGFLFTFGSMGSLSNIIAGIVLTYMRLFKINDRVKIGDVVGDVIEKSLLVTRIRTTKNEIISIPNSTVMSSHTINYSSDTVSNGLILHTTVTIGYDVPWKDIQQALIEAADRTEFLLKDPKPFVLQTSLEDFYVAYQINAYTKEANKQAGIYSELHKNIQDCCNEMGIEILSPHYRAARDGNMTTIPADYLDKDYKAPSFNVKMDKDNNEPKA
ncbi:mechanosensitive ion channel family protein [Flavobacterium alkalisoli]|uniref:Mechanosensitive ion channel family protein n=1 Tax=Flavobacterium alkalisoli TaxID=2602769 RepID=A0A5B9FVA3_9FLAO|nr:mechanosensitive ion channel family protein [Flavobacterium alkalisoli]QEE50940.1 mechanosensitive ion channel family protein [Flavobacterium alkalisoli]